jgi:CHAT domain-containing protein/tetratricopeptide (TPR) repeat protein
MKLRRGETPAALQEADQGLQWFSSEKSEWHWRFQILKAAILDVQGRERDALALLQEELPPALATSDLAVRRRYTQGSANSSLRLLKEADRDLTEAEALAKEYHPELLGEVALKYGTLQFWRGDTVAAEAAYKEALERGREQKDQFLEAAALSGLGVATTMQGHYDESIDWNRAAAELGRSVGASASLAWALGNTGWSYAELGDYENALRFYKQAEEVSVKSGLLSGRTYWSASIAYAYQGLGNDTKAGAILKEALPLARSQDDKQPLAQCLSQLAWIALRAGNSDQAEAYNQEAAALAEKGLGARLAIDSALLRGAIAESRRKYNEAEKSFQAVIEEPQASKFQQWRAEAELSKVYADEGLDAKAEREFRQSLGTIESARASVQSEENRLFFLFNTIAFYSNFVEYLISRHRTEEALQVTELSRARTLAEGLGARSTTLTFPLPNFHPQTIAKRRNAVLLVYWLAPQQSYLWAITPEKTGFFTIAKQSEIESLVNEYRVAMQSGKDLLAAENPVGQKLFETLVAPAQKMIPKNSRVIVFPDANLYRLNFEALLVPGSAPHYWIEDVTLSTASSLTLLNSSGVRPQPKEKRLLLVGNTEQADNDFPALAQAPLEMKDVEQYFPNADRKVLEGKQATPAAYLNSNPEQFSYQHFVTHGIASLTHPLESAVILSPEGGAYKLYARDIVQHPLKAELVTISACNGAGTRSYSGEGLVGLSWAFVRAGAHNVISALWEVSDVSTPRLMDTLYSELSQGKDPATALRDAKLSLLHSPDPHSVFRKPFYWAPFQLYAGS